MRKILLLIVFLTTWLNSFSDVVVADRDSHLPLVNATVYDKSGKVIGFTNKKGIFSKNNVHFPLKVRYLGYKEKIILENHPDTIFLVRSVTELPELVVGSKKNFILHLLAYEREYSTLSSLTDTVFLFREKLVDFLINPNQKSKFRGWLRPRIIKSDSYYRFINNKGLDSVSDKCNNHFSWSDWIGIPKMPTIPEGIKSGLRDSETIMGKYMTYQIWQHNDSILEINLNLLADKGGFDFYPSIKHLIKDEVDFDKFKINLQFNPVLGDSLNPVDLDKCSFYIESTGRGHDMFQFHKINETFDVITSGEIYFLDREYISLKEAKEWENMNFANKDIEYLLPQDLPELPQDVAHLINRVRKVDHVAVRTSLPPNQNLKGGLKAKPQNIGMRALTLLKDLVGITSIRAHRNFNRKWSDFKKERIKKNNSL